MTEADNDPINWNVNLEVSLFHAMRRHKPVGVNRHFQMIFVHEKLNESIPRKISSQQVWCHLTEMYDLQALNESEILPFPNKEIDFQLPEADYGDLKKRDFPRTPKEERSSKSEDHKSSTPSSSHHSKSKSGRDRDRGDKDRGDKDKDRDRDISSLHAHLMKAHEREDSPKREQRKRTRQSIGSDSPATRDRDTPTPKRSRRN